MPTPTPAYTLTPAEELPISALRSAQAASEPSGRPQAIGWERNAQGKLAPKVADLGPLMDPTR